MKTLERNDWDLWSIMVGSLLLMGGVLVLPNSILSILLGIPFILFFPGYAITSVLFPALRDLNIVERVAISFGLSIAIFPVVGIGLNLYEVGAKLSLILLIISAITVVFVFIGMIRRYRRVDAYRPIALGMALNRASSFAGLRGSKHKVMSVVLVIALVLSGSALAYLVSNPPQGQSFTEFYILGPDGNATDYPHKLVVGQTASVTLGIINHEHRQVNYTLEVWLADVTIVNNQTTVNSMYLFETRNISLVSVPVDLVVNGARQYETNYTFQIQLAGQFKLFFLLYLDHEPVLPELIYPYTDYAATQSFRITDAINNKMMSLNLVLSVK